MNKFKPGDTVRVIMSGWGISGDKIGKTTVITETNGSYDNTHDGVKTRDFVNPGFDNWIGEESFVLAKPREWDE